MSEEQATAIVASELERCGIKAHPVDPTSGVKYPGASAVLVALEGRIGEIRIRRAWCRWNVVGLVPMEVAKRVYAHPVGRADVRALGDCGHVPPDSYGVIYHDADGNRLVSDSYGTQAALWDDLAPKHFPDQKRPIFVPDAAAVAARSYVDGYHVDSELGLYILATELARAEQCPDIGEWGLDQEGVLSRLSNKRVRAAYVEGKTWRVVDPRTYEGKLPWNPRPGLFSDGGACADAYDGMARCDAALVKAGLLAPERAFRVAR